jgi:hypothetical protein
MYGSKLSATLDINSDFPRKIPRARIPRADRARTKLSLVSAFSQLSPSFSQVSRAE